MSAVLLTCRITLVAVFAFAGVAKARDRRGFAGSLAALGFHRPGARRTAAALVPLAELALALLLAVPPCTTAGFVLAVPFCAVLAAVPAAAVARGRSVSCACFGSTTAVMGGWHIARNLLLLALAGTGTALALTGGTTLPAAVPATLLAAGTAALLTTLIVFTDDFAALLRAPAAPRAGGA
ncbi:MauE/DoxX family redox-associated membrane protein [Streptomyces sp. NPDC001070]